MGSGCSLTSKRSNQPHKGQGRKESPPLSVSGLDARIVSASGNHGNQTCPGRCLLPWRRSRDVDDEGHVVKTGPTWKEMLEEAGNVELWDGKPRRTRGGWKSYIRAAEGAVRAQRRALSTVDVNNVLEGDLNDLDRVKASSSKVNVFISSTFTDTKAERNQLMKDVFPFLRDMCRVLGLDFGSVDMRWGVKEETTREHGTTDVCLQQVQRSTGRYEVRGETNREHGTTDVCLQQVQRCCAESCGPAFLTILGNKYGFRPLPAKISQSEFDKLIRSLRSQSQPTNDLTDFYLLDTNNVPPIYILKPRDDSVSKDEWWDISQDLQQKLQLAARQLPAEEREKYFVSVTEQEIHEGCFKNENRNSQVVYVNRELADITHKHHRNSRLVDMANGYIDLKAQSLMNDLKFNKLPKSLSECPKSVLNMNYSDKKKNCFAQVKRTCDEICRVLCDNILATYRTKLHVIRDPLYEEVIRHSQFLIQKSQVFKGHDALLEKISAKMLSEEGSKKAITVLYGTAGSGKTSALAVLVKRLKMSLMPTACLVLRFIGTTSDSGTVHDLLWSICQQIARVYDKNPTEVPEDYEALLVYFKHCLAFSSASKPLLIVLDSLDQLLDENCGHSLKWLSVQSPLPAHTHILLSTNPGEVLEMLQAHLPKSSVFELQYLKKESALEVVQALMEARNRTLTDQQMEILVKAFEWNPFPLYLKALVDTAVRWRSYDIVTEDRIAAGVSGMTSLMLERMEGKYGRILVHHAMAYISASKNGLSQNELEDILSCDDEVLDEVFEFWMPPCRRIPPLLWVRIRSEVRDVLMKKGSDGSNVYTWYHKQVREMTAARYLDKCSPPFRQRAHRALADYFDGRWAAGKVWVPKVTSRTVKDLSPRLENRMVPPQPLVLCSDRGDKQRQLNRRKLRELMYHLLRCGDLERLEEVCCDLEFVEARFEAGQGNDCVADFRLAARGESTPLIHALCKVLVGGLQHLLVEPGAIYQMVRQQAEDNPTRALLAGTDRNVYPLNYITEDSDSTVDDPCELTLRGHTAAVRCCQYSPDGTYIASTGEDGSLRIWDAQTGAEHVTIMGLPGPTYPKIADNMQVGDRPCVWDVSGSKVITGSEDGRVQAWTTTGAQVPMTPGPPAHTAPVTGLSVTSHRDLLASCSKDGTLKVWTLDTFKPVTTIRPGQGEVMGCEFSPNGRRISLIFTVTKDAREPADGKSGLNVYSTSDWSMKSSRFGADNRKLCCLSYSPDGAMIATGSDLNVVELWEGEKSEAETLPKQHHAYVRCVQFTDGGARLVSCGDDFMVMVWDVAQRRHLATVAGHLHRVTSVSVCLKGEGRLVTASRDTTLKVWDYGALRTGRVPDADGIPFNVLQVSRDRKYVMTVQGVNSFARIYETSRLGKADRVAKTPKQPYSVLAALWTSAGDRVVLLNAGHSGNSPVDAYKRAGVQVVPFNMSVRRPESAEGTESGDDQKSVSLDVKCPSCIAVNRNYIAVGTYTKEVHVFHETDLTHANRISWDPEDQPQKVTSHNRAGLDNQITSLDLHPHKDHVAAVWGTEIRVWSVRSIRGSTLKAKVPSHNGHPIHACAYTPNARFLLYSAMAHVVLLSATSRRYRTLHVISGHVDLVHSLSVCPTSRHLATASLDGTLRVWGLGAGGQGAGGQQGAAGGGRMGALRAVYYGSVARRVAFVDSLTLLVGGGTGPVRTLVIEGSSEVGPAQKSPSVSSALNSMAKT